MTDTSGAASSRPRWVYPALIASLAVNLLFVGGFATALWHRHGGPHGEPGLLGFTRELPGDRQRVVREDIVAARQALQPLRNAIREAWAQTNVILTEEPFDKDKYKASMDQLAEAETKFKAAISAMMADTASKLTPEERRILQGWREKRRPFSRKMHRDDPGGDDKGPGKPEG